MRTRINRLLCHALAYAGELLPIRGRRFGVSLFGTPGLRSNDRRSRLYRTVHRAVQGWIDARERRRQARWDQRYVRQVQRETRRRPRLWT
jgi:hypothetical protein